MSDVPRENARCDGFRLRLHLLATVALLLASSTSVAARGWNPVEALTEGVKHVVGEVTKATETVVKVGQKGIQEVGNAVSDLGKAAESMGGDGGKLLGGVLKETGESVRSVGDTTASFVITGVAKPTREVIDSMASVAQGLSEIDPSRPETVEEAIRRGGAAATALVLNAERALERAAIDGSSIGLELLPEPVEGGLRHASGEVVREIEKKNPQVAEWLRRLPVTSHLYRYLRGLGAPQEGCNPDWVFARLDTEARKGLDDGAKWASMFTTPSGKGAGIAGWTPTYCRASAVGVAVRDAAYSADDLVTIDLRLLALSVGGQAAPSGRFLRVEVLPIGRAHDVVRYHQIRKDETVLVSGFMFMDEDPPHSFPELHPIDDLEIIAVPKGSTFSPEAHLEPAEGYFAVPQQAGTSLRFGRYEVKDGDTLENIAKAFYGNGDWPTIYRANRSLVRSPDHIVAGWILNIPVATEGGLAAAGGSGQS